MVFNLPIVPISSKTVLMEQGLCFTMYSSFLCTYYCTITKEKLATFLLPDYAEKKEGCEFLLEYLPRFGFITILCTSITNFRYFCLCILPR